MGRKEMGCVSWERSSKARHTPEMMGLEISRNVSSDRIESSWNFFGGVYLSLYLLDDMFL